MGGTCSGFAIPFAKSIGAKNTEDSQKYLWNGCWISLLFWVNGTMFALRNTLTGMGYSAYSVFSGVCELIGKAIGGILAVKWFGFWGICIATPLAWFLAMVYCGILVRHFLGQRCRAAV